MLLAIVASAGLSVPKLAMSTFFHHLSQSVVNHFFGALFVLVLGFELVDKE